jgi:hypothetical protein
MVPGTKNPYPEPKIGTRNAKMVPISQTGISQTGISQTGIDGLVGKKGASQFASELSQEYFRK